MPILKRYDQSNYLYRILVLTVFKLAKFFYKGQIIISDEL